MVIKLLQKNTLVIIHQSVPKWDYFAADSLLLLLLSSWGGGCVLGAEGAEKYKIIKICFCISEVL